MSNLLHRKTVLQVLSDYFELMARNPGGRYRLSEAKVAQIIIEAHERISADIVTGIEFNKHPDPHTRYQNDAMRIKRWLTGEVPMPPDFMPSFLAALPMEMRVRCVTDMFLHVGVSGQGAEVDPVPVEAFSTKRLQKLMKESNEANIAYSTLTDGATEQELLDARKEISEARAVFDDELKRIDSALAGSE